MLNHYSVKQPHYDKLFFSGKFHHAGNFKQHLASHSRTLSGKQVKASSGCRGQVVMTAAV
jgi:hypothetical protein